MIVIIIAKVSQDLNHMGGTLEGVEQVNISFPLVTGKTKLWLSASPELSKCSNTKNKAVENHNLGLIAVTQGSCFKNMSILAVIGKKKKKKTIP